MRRINWITTLFLLLSPLAALGWGWIHVSSHGIAIEEIALFLVLLAASGFSITAGYHRLFAHGTYQASRPVKIFYLLFGAAALQNSAIWWSAGHRQHHRKIDTEGDPYNIEEGFWWAHIGWLLWQKEQDTSNVPDLWKDPLVRLQHRIYYPLALTMAFGLPLAVGFAVGNPWGCLLWGGLIRAVTLHHSTFLVNSLAHYVGSRPYTRAISARDSFVTALLTFGEGYHNFHHKFATDYRNGLRWYQWDPTKWLINVLAWFGHAWELYRAPREKIVAAEVTCATETLTGRLRDRSSQAAAYVRERVGDLAHAFQGSAERVSQLERELALLKRSWSEGSHKQMDWIRSELREARREFRVARARWRAAVADLYRQPALETA